MLELHVPVTPLLGQGCVHRCVCPSCSCLEVRARATVRAKPERRTGASGAAQLRTASRTNGVGDGAGAAAAACIALAGLRTGCQRRCSSGTTPAAQSGARLRSCGAPDRTGEPARSRRSVLQPPTRTATCRPSPLAPAGHRLG
ncbi:hypothetical protein FA09DRAFT_328769 [Tilletiopsis washingtonensis]|uniref:Uncharacterized protein n=1 Tax=Tilletiopsis washingtonensis TaxID=58919 RepID=A0A316ZCE3_9BASI|nr:hypothetical protein FA09DRAFT_328769 [Tilletiopsis washingtonensis]PWN99370.1 hypothetical protein FA09DRAFT_328769 [Tilletiopsis washingtonensis]